MMDDLLSQLRDNPRLRWGLALIVGMAWLYGALVLRDEVADAEQRHRSATQSISRLQTQLAQPEWVGRAVSARAMAVQLEGKLWQAPTPGLAQSAYQDWLAASFIKSGIGNPQIIVTVVEDAPPAQSAAPAGALPVAGDVPAASSTPPDLWKIKAKLNFEFNAPTFIDLMARLENHEKQTVINTLTVRKEPVPRVEMEVIAYFQKQLVVKP
jgi:hypothetical protein